MNQSEALPPRAPCQLAEPWCCCIFSERTSWILLQTMLLSIEFRRERRCGEFQLRMWLSRNPERQRQRKVRWFECLASFLAVCKTFRAPRFGRVIIIHWFLSPPNGEIRNKFKNPKTQFNSAMLGRGHLQSTKRTERLSQTPQFNRKQGKFRNLK